MNTIPLSQPLPSPTDGHARLARGWLKVDLVLCVLMALNALTCFVALLSMEPGTFDALRAGLEGAASACVALFGITGNILLLRRKRAGLWFAGGALLSVAAGMACAIWAASHMIGNSDEIGCDPEVVLAGAILGVMLRLCLNFLYVLALAATAKSLPRDAPAQATVA